MAASRPHMRFVPVKSIEQQSQLWVHRLREGIKAERTACINRIRGLLLEFGIAIPNGVRALRLREVLGLRVKDVDFDRHAIVVRSGKGDKDRVVMLPKALIPRLQAQLAHARAIWGQDRAGGRGGVFLPHALERKYPRAGET
jgi:transposase